MREFLAQAESRLYQTICQPLETSLCDSVNFCPVNERHIESSAQRHCVGGVLLYLGQA